ncbi:methylisocitrate lyase [Thermomonospora echinospora]|uniref:Methylisocitrate lyase n=1 Tax=Thermomonospora echinospora TaxID=1992 RepID=A0A1H5TAB3_9ACTN|nr:isocitrate lyase/PEP mutase family protein [Thermomonospora echinospora]SEF59729.1 methylisocitrate lyase [Thermomonospora echinospora]
MSVQNGYPADRLRARMTAGPPVAVAGCHDALGARLAEAAGFEAIHLSGALVSAAVLGLPDLGFAGATDMLDALRRVTAGTGLPVVADADTGYGDPLQAAETTRRYERAGAAALHLEDQVQPKRCGHSAGVRLVDLPVAVARLRAAVAARERLVVIARTDALPVAGADEALRRVDAFAATGADAVMVEGAVDAATVRRVREAAGGLPVVVNNSAAGPPADPLDVLAKAGARLVLFPVAAALAGAQAMRETYRRILRDGRAPDPAMTWTELNDLLGLPGLAEQEARWLPGSPDPSEEIS